MNLPHSFSLPYFAAASDFYVGYGWYRKTVDFKREWVGKRVTLEFDGVFQVAKVFVNGQAAGEHRGGYTGFALDITVFLVNGPNVLVVLVNNLWDATLAPRAGEHAFSGGIYRNVRLVVTDPVRIAWCGTTVTTPHVSVESASVNVVTEVQNGSQVERRITVRTVVHDLDGLPVATAETPCLIARSASRSIAQDLPAISKPRLWHPDSPYLYEVVTTLVSDDELLDEYRSPLGLRWFEFTADRGFFLNGEHLYLIGANVHQDHAGWGDAITDAAAWRDVKMIKEAGFNFIRGSHYPHSPAFSEACDRLGMLFWSENAFWGIGGFKEDGYWNCSAYPPYPQDRAAFEANVREQLAEMIRVHRNHPSVIAWSLCNEVFFSAAETMPEVRRFLSELTALAKSLDPTRPAAIGGCQRGQIDKLGDIAGYNGDGSRISEYLDPGIPSLVSEYGSTITDRPGKYEPGWGEMPAAAPTDSKGAYPWRFPWRSGEAIWCGFDHGSIAGRKFGGMGMVDYFRIPKRQWFWYRNAYRDVPPPVWPIDAEPAALWLSADKTALQRVDGTDDALVTITLVDAQGRPVSRNTPITLSIESGPGELPTGRSITFAPDSDIAVRDGQAAIEFRAYHGGETTLSATSPGLPKSMLKIQCTGEPAFVAGQTPLAPDRPYLPFERAKIASDRQIVVGLHNPTRASSETAAHPAAHANDGNPATYWQSAIDGDAWWQVDLEKFVEIECVHVRFASDATFSISVSDDGVRWVTIVDPQDAKPSTEPIGTNSVRKAIGRIVRVTLTPTDQSAKAALAYFEVSGVIATR